ncbi:MAG: transposase [Steroidobacteraceae bacterium]
MLGALAQENQAGPGRWTSTDYGSSLPSRSRKSTWPRANAAVALPPFEFLDRLEDVVPPNREHPIRYHGAFARNHNFRFAVTALAIGNVGNQRKAPRGAGGPTCGRRLTPG